MHIVEEVFSDNGCLSYTVHQLSFRDDKGNVWFLGPDKYRVYGLTESQMSASTELLTPGRSCASTVEVRSLRRVKVEPGTKDIHVLSDSDGKEHLLRPSLQAPRGWYGGHRFRSASSKHGPLV